MSSLGKVRTQPPRKKTTAVHIEIAGMYSNVLHQIDAIDGCSPWKWNGFSMVFIHSHIRLFFWYATSRCFNVFHVPNVPTFQMSIGINCNWIFLTIGCWHYKCPNYWCFASHVPLLHLQSPEVRQRCLVFPLWDHRKVVLSLGIPRGVTDLNRPMRGPPR